MDKNRGILPVRAVFRYGRSLREGTFFSPSPRPSSHVKKGCFTCFFSFCPRPAKNSSTMGEDEIGGRSVTESIADGNRIPIKLSERDLLCSLITIKVLVISLRKVLVIHETHRFCYVMHLFNFAKSLGTPVSFAVVN